MADTRRHFPIQQLDLDQILQEAQHRWLRPSEICEILRNHQKFQLTPDPPSRPPAGSLFLFDRKALRYFRKDGHRWRKKKDGKTVKEAHEKLKAGSVDVLHCYYAHGEDNENFQRRSYWMLDGQLEHIVLVHYREVKEGYRSSIPRVQNADPGSQVGSPQGSSAPFLAQGNSPAPTAQTSYVSSPNTVDWNGQALSSEVDDGNSGENPGTSYLSRPIFGSLSPNISLHGPQAAGSIELLKNHPGSDFVGSDFYQGSGSSVWDAIQSSSRNVHGTHEQKFFFEQPGGADLITPKLIDARLDASSALQDVAFGDRLISDADTSILKTNSHRLFQEHDFNLVEPQLQSSSDPKTMVTSATEVNNSSREVGSNNDQTGELKKLDSFGRWMDKEIGRDCDDSLMASDSGNYWNTLDPQNDDKEVSSLSRHMQLDVDSLGPSLSQEQLFSIRDFSPDWAYSGVETKVLITGMFLGGTKHSTDTKWSCMFGEIEVSAEVLIDNVIRCQAPIHAPGRVPFYVTCSNRLACSEIREFEYREKPYGVAFSLGISSGTEDVVRFQIRLAKMLCSGLKRSWLDCSIKGCDKCKLKEDIYSVRSGFETDWERIQDTSFGLAGNYMNTRDLLIENLLKDRLCEWLVCRVHEEGKGPNILDNEGQGVIHLTSALGYEWAMGLIVAAGVSPNFRDAQGRTGLHWASYFGREGTVTVLVRLGAAPGAVEDPTPAFPGGQTAADLASSRGYKGIAGYLAEADLTSHLSLLTMDKSVLETFAATMAADRATATATQTTITSDGEPNEQLALRGSLAAVRNSAHAAAMIQAAFRARSFQYRQLTKGNGDISEVPLDLASLGSLNKVQRMSHYEDYLHLAAVKIQKKYRGWKGRNEFLKIRGRIVKIQAHVRGHQVRKQYKRVVWSVSIVEKAILRWRRKGAGLRGFRVDKKVGDPGSDSEKSDEYDFLRIGRKQKFAGVEKALARVQSMVRHPEARDQYMRMVTKFENLKMGGEESSSSPK